MRIGRFLTYDLLLAGLVCWAVVHCGKPKTKVATTVAKPPATTSTASQVVPPQEAASPLPKDDTAAAPASADATATMVAPWSAGVSLRGAIVGNPSCVAVGEDKLSCFARGLDSTLGHIRRTAGQWGEWESLGGAMASSPECLTSGSENIDCFARATDNTWVVKSLRAGVWKDWHSFGGSTPDDPSCSSWGPGRIDCFIRGANAQLYHVFSGDGGTTWGGPEALGGVLTSSPSCVTPKASFITCAFKDGVNSLSYITYAPTKGWSGPQGLGGGLLVRPECTARAGGTVTCVVIGTDANAYRQSFEADKWTGYTRIGGEFETAVSCASSGGQRVDCLGRAKDGKTLWHTFTDSAEARFSAWDYLDAPQPPPPASDPAVKIFPGEPFCTAASGGVDCLVIGTDNALWYFAFSPQGS